MNKIKSKKKLEKTLINNEKSNDKLFNSRSLEILTIKHWSVNFVFLKSLIEIEIYILFKNYQKNKIIKNHVKKYYSKKFNFKSFSTISLETLKAKLFKPLSVNVLLKIKLKLVECEYQNIEQN